MATAPPYSRPWIGAHSDWLAGIFYVILPVSASTGVIPQKWASGGVGLIGCRG